MASLDPFLEPVIVHLVGSQITELHVWYDFRQIFRPMFAEPKA